jgi:hypothetical protein
MSEDTTVVSSAVDGRNSRGEVGEATPALTIKQQWKAAKTRLSLKAYVRVQVREGNQVAKDWLANKSGKRNQKRSDANIALAKVICSASKAARKKSK